MHTPKRLFWLETLLVFLAFVLCGAYSVPDVNEAHYLGKAMHFWNPDYVKNDFFLNTPDAHLVFYYSVGWISQFCEKETFAWVCRSIVWFLLAWGWVYMVSPIFSRFGAALLSALLFCFLSENYNFAGEWVVGGVEAKCFAYAFLFLGVGFMVRNRWNLAWVFMGVAALFHVLVGGWGLVALGLTWVFMRWWSPNETHIPSFLTVAPWAIVAILISLPALVPALLMNVDVSHETVRLANRLYVFERLPHHLLLSHIVQRTPEKALYFGMMFMIWNALCARPRYSNGEMHLRMFVYSTTCFLVGGWIINLLINTSPDFVASLMRFYWFRMVDVCVPMGVAILGVKFCSESVRDEELDAGKLKNPSVEQEKWTKKERKEFERRRKNLRKRLQLSRTIMLAALVLAAGYQVYFAGQRVWESKPPRQCAGAAKGEDWLDVCRFAREKTAPDDIFMVPYNTRTFSWYSRRPVVGVWKDIPQDAASLCEWWNRIQIQFYGVDEQKMTRPYGRLKSFSLLPQQRLDAIKRKYHAKYVVGFKGDLPAEKQVYENKTFAVWEL
ncbi:MAG: hypothetical protein Q4D38_05430 [Planctomycetia bacterium]|nr:hypothetical protein [Planctomycetia bacterium]